MFQNCNRHWSGDEFPLLVGTVEERANARQRNKGPIVRGIGHERGPRCICGRTAPVAVADVFAAPACAATRVSAAAAIGTTATIATTATATTTAVELDAET
jgi:hypothetical protein